MSDCICSDYTMTASQRQQLPALHWGDRQPCQLPPPTEEYRTKRNGERERRIKGPEMETLLTFLIRAWLKSCLPSRVSWSNLLTNENVFLSFFSLFILGKRLCVTPFVSFDRFLVTIDDLWTVLSLVWKLLCLPLHYPFSLFLSFFSITSSSCPFTPYSFLSPNLQFLPNVSLSYFLLQFTPLSPTLSCAVGNCLQFMSGSEEQSGRLTGIQRINLSERSNTHTCTINSLRVGPLQKWCCEL